MHESYSTKHRFYQTLSSPSTGEHAPSSYYTPTFGRTTSYIAKHDGLGKVGVSMLSGASYCVMSFALYIYSLHKAFNDSQQLHFHTQQLNFTSEFFSCNADSVKILEVILLINLFII